MVANRRARRRIAIAQGDVDDRDRIGVDRERHVVGVHVQCGCRRLQNALNMSAFIGQPTDGNRVEMMILYDSCYLR